MDKNMSGRFCIVLPLAVMLPACTGFEDMTTCPKGDPVIIINLQSSKIAVTPPNYCAEPGEAIPVYIKPAKQQRNTVKTIAKPGNPNWLSRSNSSYGNLIIIEVPVDVDEHCPEPECKYSYSVEAPGKERLDPMITVRK